MRLVCLLKGMMSMGHDDVVASEKNLLDDEGVNSWMSMFLLLFFCFVLALNTLGFILQYVSI